MTVSGESETRPSPEGGGDADKVRLRGDEEIGGKINKIL